MTNIQYKQTCSSAFCPHQVCFANFQTNPAKAGWCVSPTGGATKKAEVIKDSCHHCWTIRVYQHPSLLALPFNILCSPVQALPALIRFASQTCAPIPLKRAGALVQQGEPQKKERTSVLSFFCGSPCWTRTNDLAVNSRSLLPTELRRIIGVLKKGSLARAMGG